MARLEVDEQGLDSLDRRFLKALIENYGGGPVGMGALARNPGVISGAVVMNTGFNAPTEKADISKAHAAVKTPVVGEFILETFGSIFDRLPEAQGVKPEYQNSGRWIAQPGT